MRFDCWCTDKVVPVLQKQLLSWDFQTRFCLEFAMDGVLNMHAHETAVSRGGFVRKKQLVRDATSESVLNRLSNICQEKQ